MPLLDVIWWIAALLVVSALAWMSGLILLRVVHARRTTRRAADRRQVEAALIGAMQGRSDVEAAFAPFRGRARLLAETLLDFLGIVRGEDRRLVVGALEHLGADRTLRERVFSGSLPGRLASVEALGAFPGPETQFALIRASTRGPAEVRLAALRSLWQAGGEVDVARLVGGLEGGEFPPSGAFSELLRLVVEADPAAAVAALEQLGRSAPARGLLAQALGAAGAYGAIPALTAQAQAPEAPVRTAAIEALGRLQHPAAQPVLARALGDSDWQVRSAAADAVGDARLAGLVEGVANLLDDPVWRVRHQAAAALGKLGPAGTARLEAVARSDHEVARHAAALVLAGVA
ncbi:HEAT repeat domain-containing protein [Phenylobacterium sp.]|jgi:HEAT repeat protein|uniref:HEAT repeat domain-containing protein n=1 Tax=Phenylobacterium sp. TaxID=1871053 RepID=UPI002F92A413